MFGSGGYPAGHGDPAKVTVDPKNVAFQPYPTQSTPSAQQTDKGSN